MVPVTAEVAGSSPVVPAINQSEMMGFVAVIVSLSVLGGCESQTPSEQTSGRPGSELLTSLCPHLFVDVQRGPGCWHSHAIA
jgi:hypothetical protein